MCVYIYIKIRKKNTKKAQYPLNILEDISCIESCNRLYSDVDVKILWDSQLLICCTMYVPIFLLVSQIMYSKTTLYLDCTALEYVDRI